MTLDAHRIEPLRPYRVTGTPEPENSMVLRSYNELALFSTIRTLRRHLQIPMPACPV